MGMTRAEEQRGRWRRTNRSGRVSPSVLLLLAFLTSCSFHPIHDQENSAVRSRAQRRRTALDGGAPSESTLGVLMALGLGDWERRFDGAMDALAATSPAQRALFPVGAIDLAEAEVALWVAGRRRRFDSVDQSLHLRAARATLRGLRDVDPSAPSRFPLTATLLEVHNAALARFLEISQELWGHPSTWPEKAATEGFHLLLNLAPPALDVATFDAFIPADRREPVGLTPRYQVQGLGASLIAERHNLDDENRRIDLHALEHPSFPMTARMEIRPEGGVAIGFYDSLAAATRSLDRPWPLSADFTTALAHGFGEESFRIRENLALFFPSGARREQGIYLFEPYDPDRIPLLLIHGIWSSPLAWAQLQNEILGDPKLRRRYQVWSYFYPTGLSILENAAALRKAVFEMRALAPSGECTANRDMVVVGHSMGGLLAKALVLDPGKTLTETYFRCPVEDLPIPRKLQERLRSALEFRPVPNISEMVFIATPHRGSELAANLLGSLVSQLVDSPDDLEEALDALRSQAPSCLVADDATLLELVDGVRCLRPDARVLAALNAIPLPRATRFHSIAGKLPRARIEGDGVVGLGSARLDGVPSEFVLPAGHASHQDPRAILEIRRILREHLEALP
ncbi:MAG TPA: alpha/beta fold hydrolase [Planctomycetes bacterium]|nr:alpha/beta fold hydrolase [Planctomycetota bacterium]